MEKTCDYKLNSQNLESYEQSSDLRAGGDSSLYSNIFKKIFSDRNYFFLIGKMFKIKILKQKTFLFAVIDVNNICNLKCKHCYWWLSRDDEKKELTKEDWKKIIHHHLKKNHILQVSIVGGEPMLRPDILEVFNEEIPGKFNIITNGTYKLIPYSGLIHYRISVDGMKETHDKIRGKTFEKIENTIRDYTKETGRKVWISMVINTLNYKEVVDVVEYWKDLAESINFEFHTPFADNDPLWIPYGKEKNEVLDKIISMKNKYHKYVLNEINQLELLRSPWGGDKTGPTNCPTWAILALDHQAKKKTPCCLGSANKEDMKPMCENCGLSNYSSLFIHGIHL